MGTKPKRRRLGTLARVGVGSVVGLGALWLAIHEVPWLGPMLAEGARAVVGPRPVAIAEDIAYGVQDRLKLLTQGSAPPRTYWAPPPSEEPSAPPVSEVAEDERPRPPAPATPPFAAVAAPGDGQWLPMRPPGDELPAAMWKTVVHPDPKRPFAVTAVVAIDRRAVDLVVMPGTDEPKAAHVPREERTGLIPASHHDRLLAAFNGGFRAMHGNYGMRVGTRSFIPPRDIACTIAFLPDDRITIATWTAIESEADRMIAFRQTPPCLLEAGAPNPGLLHEFNRNWGATVGGDTIIRRSALGLSEDGRHLFYALGDAVTAQSIGRAMQVVGAHAAAQLDVNYAYPRFVLFEQNAAGFPIASSPLIPDLKFSPTDYVVGPQQRDFFYLVRKASAT